MWLLREHPALLKHHNLSGTTKFERRSAIHLSGTAIFLLLGTSQFAKTHRITPVALVDRSSSTRFPPISSGGYSVTVVLTDAAGYGWLLGGLAAVILAVPFPYAGILYTAHNSQSMPTYGFECSPFGTPTNLSPCFRSFARFHFSLFLDFLPSVHLFHSSTLAAHDRQKTFREKIGKR